MSDKFSIQNNAYIVCQSSSGKRYELTMGGCSCPGWGFRRTCRHYVEALDLGLLDKLEMIKKQGALGSDHIRESRIKAIAQFLIKNGLRLTSVQIKRLEPKVTAKMTPKKFLELAKKI